MLTGDMSVGVHVKTPVLLLKEAPLGRAVLNCRSTLSPSGSDVVTVSVPVTPTVTLKVFTTWMRGIPLAIDKTNNVNISFKQDSYQGKQHSLFDDIIIKPHSFTDLLYVQTYCLQFKWTASLIKE